MVMSGCLDMDVHEGNITVETPLCRPSKGLCVHIL